jgi:diaminopimelate epimerase
MLTKVEGAGNDFVLGTGSWARRLADEPGLVVRLCDRRRGIGADGVLALVAEGDARARLVHRNADGSPSAFCANGTRCAARAAVELLGLDPRLVIATGWAEVPAVVGRHTVALELPPPPPPSEVTLESGAGSWRGWRLVVGVPHLVLPVTGLDTLEIAAVAPPLRRHPDLGPGGANVHFVEPAAAGGLRIRSFERGVEAETLCCGSGVVAAGLVTLARSGAATISVFPRSGDRLSVEALGPPPAARSRLTGPARLVGEVRLDRSWLADGGD